MEMKVLKCLKYRLMSTTYSICGITFKAGKEKEKSKITGLSLRKSLKDCKLFRRVYIREEDHPGNDNGKPAFYFSFLF